MIFVLGAERRGGVRSYMLGLTKSIQHTRFHFNTHETENFDLESFGYSNGINFFEILKIAIKIKPSLVFANTIRGGLNALILNFILRLPYIYVAHTVRSEQLPKGVKRFFILAIENLVYRTSKKNIAICKSEFNYISKRYPNCDYVPTGMIVNKTLEMSKTDFVFYNIGSVEDRKNPFLFIEIANSLRDYSFLSFIWYGDGPLLEMCRNRILELKLKNIVFFGSISNDSLLQRIIDHRAMLFTSKLEGVPISILESFASLKPVISFEYSGCKPQDLIRENETGNIFKSVSEAASLIKKYSTDEYNIYIHHLQQMNQSFVSTHLNFIAYYSKILNITNES